MPISVVPYDQSHVEAVREFNRRLAAGGWNQGFPESPVPKWLPPGRHPRLYNELYVAVDQDGVVRGGYILKHQDFVVRGKVRSIANYAFPLSEGVVDRRFGMVGVTMILDAQKRQPLLFGLGLGGADNPSARVMKGVGWSSALVPFYFGVVRGRAFLRNISYLRGTRLKRLALDAAAFLGLGALGVATLRLVRRRVRRPPDGSRADTVSSFGAWADELWEKAGDRYRLAGVRDSGVLNTLYPSGDSRFTSLRVTDATGAVIGWAVLLNTAMKGHSYFGDMRVGTIVDCLAAKGAETAVLYHADRELREREADLILSNQSAAEWGTAFRRLGYLGGPSNFLLTTSKRLTELIGPPSEHITSCHLNRGDGDGPINL